MPTRERLPHPDRHERRVTGVPTVVPEFPDLDGIRRQADELLDATQADDSTATPERVAAHSASRDLDDARLAVARHHGYSSWSRLEREVARKNAFHHGDMETLTALVSQDPELASDPVSSCFTNDSALGYLGVIRFHGLTDHDRIGDLARILLTAGAPADGPAGAPEPPLVTAASYGEADMVRALIEAGADLNVTGFAVPDGDALAHAIEFGNTGVVDVLAQAGAAVGDLVVAAGVGDLDGHDVAGASLARRARAARAAAVCERLSVLDQLVDSGVPVDADPETGMSYGSCTLLHQAAYWGKPRSVQHLLGRGADPNRLDVEHGSSPLGWCRHRLGEIVAFGQHLAAGHRQVESILEPITENA